MGGGALSSSPARGDRSRCEVVDADIERLTMARELKPLGFSLDEVREILDLIETRETGETLTDEQHAALANYTAQATERYERLRDRLDAADRIARRMQRNTEPSESSNLPEPAAR